MIDDSSKDNSCKTKRESMSGRMNKEDNIKKTNWEMILEQLSRDPDKIYEMSDDQRREILVFLHEEADRIVEENRKGVGVMDQIKRYADSLPPEDRRQFYSNVNGRLAQIIKEWSLRFQKLGKTKPRSHKKTKLQRRVTIRSIVHKVEGIE
jgi:hypothetical protein